MKTTNFPGNMKRKREEAIERNKAWAALTPVVKLEMLDHRLGAGLGAKKQRRKLAWLVAQT